ncbi:MAG: D-alanyl-lipoteichoic acid acyltransferase DltB, MBOAT superfamily [Verrucomicrobia bacterium]|nr:MAG: D-alanyl-lipoteichoic acid acyltransferase DltB, MBOAT superfamily [Verrucomicrobiota bacterium]
MVFQSIEYVLFLGAVLAVYFWLSAKGQNAFLVLASYVFYGWVHPWYVVLIVCVTLVDWCCAKGMEDSTTPLRKKAFFLTALTVNLVVLGAFKYFGFFVENVTALLSAIGLMPSPMLLKIALPAGISFFTFQSVSYAVDVFQGRAKACRSLVDYAAFVCFFPQLVAGPIERAAHMIPQYQKRRLLDFDHVRDGALQLLWGLFQKVAIADNAALLADRVFSLGDPSFPILWGGVIAFGVQIYADFSGYTAMARGSARLLGIELCANFRHPYLSESPPEFWRRWHMSLSTWFRDYVYIPLGGSRMGGLYWARNLFLTFLLSGLWHGAEWNYVIWGAYHGLLVVIWPGLASRFGWLTPSAEGTGSLVGVGRILLTFLLMNLGWLFFREHSLSMLLHDLQLNPMAASASEWRMGVALGVEALLYGFPLLVILPLLDRLGWLQSRWKEGSASWRWALAQGLAAAGCIYGAVSLRCEVGADFIYFQF